MIVGLFWGKEDWLSLLRADHQIHIIVGAEAMSKGGKEGVGIWRQVNTCGARFEVQNGANEGRILVRESIMFLTRPSASFEVVDAANVFSPGGLPSL